MAWTPRPHPGPRLHLLTATWDAAGLVLVATLAGWTVVASRGRDEARPLPVLALLLGVVALFAIGRAASRRNELLVPGLVAVGIAGAMVLTYPEVLESGGAPTGYANSNATLAGLGAISAVAALSASRGASRRGWAALALLLVIAVLLTESVAGVGALALAAALAAISSSRGDPAIAPLGGVVATWIALGATAALAQGADPGSVRRHEELRTELWRRAIELLRDAPLRGHGPGAFAPPRALADADLRWAHHEYLQMAAELGAVGLVLGLLVLAWLFAYLWRGRRRGAVPTVSGASALTVVALHASVDHVLHTATVPLTLALLVGWATAPRPDRGSRGSPRLRR
jgi:O-antigen ligase